MKKSIRTINALYESTFKEKGSQFIGRAYPVKDETEAREILDSVKKEHYNATHHCYAWRTEQDGDKYSDDGEPNGTAGIRILNAIEHFDLTNLLVVSIRYYGGTKLGVGPLGKAYYHSAYTALEPAKIITLVNYSKLRVSYDFDMTSVVHHLLSKYSAKIAENIYETKPAIICFIKTELNGDFENEMREATSSRVITKIIEKDQFIVEN